MHTVYVFCGNLVTCMNDFASFKLNATHHSSMLPHCTGHGKSHGLKFAGVCQGLDEIAVGTNSILVIIWYPVACIN